jgi:aryl-phospho-beta-D-glucosidase BglC (GH1 family)
VQLIRLPTGYWNWLDLGQNATPDVEDNKELAERYKNIQRVTPKQYEPYIDKIFNFAKKYGMKILLDMHGLPGS